MGLFETTIAGWGGTDAALLAELNLAQHRRTTVGVVSLSKFAELYTEDLAGEFRYAFTTEVARLLGLGGAANLKLASWLDGMVSRFDVTGIDFADDVVRARITDVLQRAGYGAGPINSVLSKGYVLESTAVQHLGRAAVQADVDAVRLALWVQAQYAKATNAAALYASRMEQGGVIAGGAAQAAAWVTAWADS